MKHVLHSPSGIYTSNELGTVEHVSEYSIGIVTALGERVLVELGKGLVDIAVIYGMRVVIVQQAEQVLVVMPVAQWYNQYVEQVVAERESVTEQIAA